ncbi:MAG: phosphatidylserine decarboxylase family protein [Bacteroidales bacterium]|nr:phosphatidylserine decarboxylase family protein [Bacteroidales bacterium]
MKIHREGYRVIIAVVIIMAVVNLIPFLLPSRYSSYWFILPAVSAILLVFIIYFFRSPDRPVKENSELILTPADGRIVAMEETYEDEYFHDKRLQVSVFMSVYDVHCNRYPFSGKVKYVKHHPGKYFIASHPKSSVYNESTSVVIERADGLCVMVKQIAGAVARRIVTYSEEGEEITQGRELGFIKFGSRVDIFLPAGTVCRVKMNQQVYANKNIVAKIKYDHLA